MRLFSIFLALLFITATACKKKPTPMSKGAFTITAILSNHEGPILFKCFNSDFTSEKTDSNTIKLTMYPEYKTLFHLALNDDEIQIFGGPDDKIIMKADSRNISGTAFFEGDHSLENNFLGFKRLKVAELEPKDYKAYYSASEADFTKAVEERKNTMIAVIQDYQKTNGLFDDAFADLMNVEITHETVNMKMEYPDMYRYFNPNDSFQVSDTYYSFLQNLETDDEKKLSSPAFKQFLSFYLDYLALNNVKSDSVQNKNVSKAVRKFEHIAHHFKEEKIRQFLYYDLMTTTFSTSFNQFAEIYDRYQETQDNETWKKEIKEKYEQISHLLPGKKSPKIEVSDNKDQRTSISDYKGKMIYIDVWASWCGPCVREIPALEKLQQSIVNTELENKIAFVSISIDHEKDAWLNILKSKNLKGTQWFDAQNWDANWVKEFRIEGIPRFILLDSEGNIIDANAPRPSDPDIRKILFDNLP
ncbi:MAG: TlpA family protein disulfide reductase [Saprospiraceae bacterium]|nr:TlpA family protein disulfide reductase [Saprospiraceae bacterium]